MIFAAENGRVGERYIISDRFMGYEINELPLPLLYAAAHGNDLAR